MNERRIEEYGGDRNVTVLNEIRRTNLSATLRISEGKGESLFCVYVLLSSSIFCVYTSPDLLSTSDFSTFGLFVGYNEG